MDARATEVINGTNATFSNAHFIGTRAEFAKDRAAAIAKRMLAFVGREISLNELSAK